MGEDLGEKKRAECNPKSSENKNKNRQVEICQTKNFCTANKAINIVKKDNLQNGRKYFQSKYLTRD
jgi:hypothetical protein